MDTLWTYSSAHGQHCRVLDRQTLWGKTVCRVWLPSTNQVLRVDEAQLASVPDTGAWTRQHLTYLASASRVLDTLQVQRRIRKQLGERETVARAARRVLRSFIDWGVLVEGDRKGMYHPAALVTIEDVAQQRWLVEAFLAAHTPEWQSLATLDKHPSLFPVAMSRVTAALLDAAPRIEVVRHGLDQEMARFHPNSNRT